MSNHTFAQVPSVSINRSSFDRSSDYKTTFNEGYLIPFFVDEVLPGDTFNVTASLFGRLATPLEFPIMDNMYLDTFWFFVPNRLIWSNFKKFMGERSPNPDSSIDYLFPQIPAPTTTGFAFMSLFDYMGIIPGKDGFSVNNYARAYNLIWNDWFRDQNLQQSATVDLGDGPDDPANYFLRKRGKRHDYFTSCTPTPQKGPAVTLPFGAAAAPISVVPTWPPTTAPFFRISAVGTANGTDSTVGSFSTGGRLYRTTGGPDLTYDPGSTLQADLTAATAATVNAVRTAVALQQFLELDMRAGTRYIEINLGHFGVKSSDARLQRPEFLGGSSERINVHPVSQNSESATTPQGNLAAFSTFSENNAGFVKSFEEHGVVFGLLSVRADLTYQQGINRMWTRRTRYDFYWPDLADIGEQAVLNKEIYYADNPLVDEAVFGYQERYGEYRYKPSLITGDFRSDSTVPLDAWHLSQDFASTPTLSSAFIEENPPIDRVVKVPSQAHFLLDAHIRNISARPMKVFSVPGLTRF